MILEVGVSLATTGVLGGLAAWVRGNWRSHSAEWYDERLRRWAHTETPSACTVVGHEFTVRPNVCDWCFWEQGTLPEGYRLARLFADGPGYRLLNDKGRDLKLYVARADVDDVVQLQDGRYGVKLNREPSRSSTRCGC